MGVRKVRRADVVTRPLREADIPAADRVMWVAFGTLLTDGGWGENGKPDQPTR